MEHNNEFSYVENKSQFNDLLQNNYHSNYIKPIQAQLFQKNIKFEIDYSKEEWNKNDIRNLLLPLDSQLEMCKNDPVC